MDVLGLLALCAVQLDAAESLKRMKVAEGLEVSLFAAEPDLVNPTSIDVDARGRVWVTEAVNYRLFKNPVMRPEGDRIRVLEDTDGDGRCDRATTFWQDRSLQAPLCVTVLGERVYVCQSPEIFYLEDTDGDGTADKKTVVLTGFGGVDHDHAIHGLTYAPDGRLYASVGDQGMDVTDKGGRRVKVSWNDADPYHAGCVIRMDPDGNHLELLADGFRNPMQPAVDSLGNVFVSDNDDDGNEQCRISYVMAGGRYGFYPKRAGDRRRDAVHWNEETPGVIPKILKTGFGSPVALIAYEGDALPKRMRGTLIHADAGPGVIRSIRYWPKGAGFSAESEILLSCPDDKWFRPVGVVAAPDGSLFVADWYDPGVGGHNLGDWTRGRIYRIASKGARYTAPKLDLASEAGLSRAARSPNPATRYLARSSLGALPKLGPESALHADPQVRREMLLTLRNRTEPWARDAVTAAAAEFARDPTDRFYREAVGIAMRGWESEGFKRLQVALGARWDRPLAELALQLHPPEALAPAARGLKDPSLPAELRMLAVRTLAMIGGRDAADALLDGLSSAEMAPAIVEALAADGGRRLAGAGKDERVLALLEADLGKPDRRRAAIDAIRELGATPLGPALVAAARRSAADRARAVEAAASLRRPDLLEPLGEFLRDPDVAVAQAAARGIANYRTDRSDQLLAAIVTDRSGPLPLRKDCIRVLAYGKSGALTLVKLAEAGKLSEDVLFDAAAATLSSPFEDVRMMAEQAMPRDKTREGKPLPPIADLLAMKGEPGRGRAVFAAERGPQCFKCHRIGEAGRDVGPALTRIGAKLAREAILESILNPGAAIAPEYQVWILQTRSQGHVTGFIRAETDEALDLVDAAGNATRIPKADIVERARSATSLMPSGLSGGMTVQELMDLVAYLQTLQ